MSYTGNSSTITGWENDFDEWHEGQILSVPKRGGLSDTKKCRGVTLMDIEEKYLVVYYLGFHSRS